MVQRNDGVTIALTKEFINKSIELNNHRTVRLYLENYRTAPEALQSLFLPEEPPTAESLLAPNEGQTPKMVQRF